MFFKAFRRYTRCIGLLSAFVTILLCLYYISVGQSSEPGKEPINKLRLINLHKNISHANWLGNGRNGFIVQESINSESQRYFPINTNPRWEMCNILMETQTDITTIDEFKKFDFQPQWMKTKEYWDRSFETRYSELMKNPKRPPLKVIIVPHSHNDPGWLRTYTGYFESDTRQIINNIVQKLQEYPDMTFIWTEISFLQLWWDQAHPTKQRALKQLVESGRLEITTGGWVMTDEANVHLYAMVDQFIEGHQWVKTNLNYTPITGWSIDPFGHGSTVPYLLSASGFKGTIIQRIHYAWKQWFAKHQHGDFIWTPYWATAGQSQSLLTHNMPFDIYSIKHSCGPHPNVCLNFDFRKIPGEYTEYSVKAQAITDQNIEKKANLLLEQYSRAASLFPHNVAMVPVGDDFRYNYKVELDQQYSSYKKLIDYINAHKEKYKVEISFGTPKDYFKAIQEREVKFPSLKGDFFVYSDIFTEGRPAYWSGYFTTRPAFKLLSRELEHNLRSLELLFTVAFNKMRQENNLIALRIYEKNYEKVVLARRNLGLFQHHDAITGTSKAFVVRDYATRLFDSIQEMVKLQQTTIEHLLQQSSSPDEMKTNFLLNDLERESFETLALQSPIHVKKGTEVPFVLFNSLAQERIEFITVRTIYPNVSIVDENGQEIEYQINPVWNTTSDLSYLGNPNFKVTYQTADRLFEILFPAKLKPLSLTIYKAVYTENYRHKMATLYCNDCSNGGTRGQALHPLHFNINNKQPGDIQIENSKMRLLFDEATGFLKTVTRKNVGKSIQCAIKFAAYRSAPFHSGAYLFKIDPDYPEGEMNPFESYGDVKIIISSGPLASEVSAIYDPLLAHTVRIYSSNTAMDRAIYIENDLNFEQPPKNRETEMFMRFVTEIENGGELPEMYSDLNGFQYQKRTKVSSIGVEGNYFPITTGAFIEDDRYRLTLLTNHAQGAASLEPGQLEVMLDRRSLYDDSRGMGEGIVDSRLTRHKFWFTIEQFKDEIKAKNEFGVLSSFTNQISNALNYPVSLYYVENSIKLDVAHPIQLLKRGLPCDIHLVTIRTQTDPNYPLFPSNSALLVVQRQGHNCRLEAHVDNEQRICNQSEGKGFINNMFYGVKINRVTKTSLTGLREYETLENLSDFYMEPMEMQTFNISFI